MKASQLQFDSPNNAAMSLRVIAEMVRREDYAVISARTGNPLDKSGLLIIEIQVPKENA